jgi:hypothetical protein
VGEQPAGRVVIGKDEGRLHGLVKLGGEVGMFDMGENIC